MSRLELTAEIITGRMGNTPDHPYLSYDYQDWLHQKGILERVPVGSPGWNGLRGMKSRLEQQRLLLVPEALFLMLMKEEGNLVSLRRQAAVLYGMGFLDVSSSETQNVKQGLHVLNAKLDQGIHTCGALFCGRGIGRGIGISAFVIRQSEIRVLYTLWKDSDKLVSRGTLAAMLYGCDGESERGSVTGLVHRMNTVFRGHLMSLDIRGVRGFGYMLVDGD